MPWTHRDFARMHYLYGMCDGDSQDAAQIFRNQYGFHKRYGSDSPTSEDSNEEDIIFPTGIDILRIHNMYERGELPNENTITGGRIEGEKIFFSHSEELRRDITNFKGDRLKTSKQLLKKCKDKTFFDNVLWTGIAEIGSNLFSAIGYEKMYQTDHDDGTDFVVNTWVGILAGEIIGPFEMPDEITDKVYAKFFKEALPELLEDVPVNIKKKMWIHVENKYVGKCVTKFLNDNYKGRWIGPNGPIHWPILAWDLNPVKYIWGIVIVNVYKNKCDSKEEILERVIIGCDESEQWHRADWQHEDRETIQSKVLRSWDACVKEKGGDVSAPKYLLYDYKLA